MYSWYQSFVLNNLPTVPPPNITLMANPSGSMLYVGTKTSILCVFTIPSVVDTPVMVNATWIGPQGAVYNGNRTTVINSQPSAMVYNTTLQISPLNSGDTGTYQCVGNISSNISYIAPFINASTNISLAVQGEDV